MWQALVGTLSGAKPRGTSLFSWLLYEADRAKFHPTKIRSSLNSERRLKHCQPCQGAWGGRARCRVCSLGPAVHVRPCVHVLPLCACAPSCACALDAAQRPMLSGTDAVGVPQNVVLAIHPRPKQATVGALPDSLHLTHLGCTRIKEGRSLQREHIAPLLGVKLVPHNR